MTVFIDDRIDMIDKLHHDIQTPTGMNQNRVSRTKPSSWIFLENNQVGEVMLKSRFM